MRHVKQMRHLGAEALRILAVQLPASVYLNAGIGTLMVSCVCVCVCACACVCVCVLRRKREGKRNRNFEGEMCVRN